MQRPVSQCSQACIERSPSLLSTWEGAEERAVRVAHRIEQIFFPMYTARLNDYPFSAFANLPTDEAKQNYHQA